MQQSQEKIARLEQEKEHWLLEAQLGKVRLEKENQRIADLESQLAAALGGGASPPTFAPAPTPAPGLEEAEGAAGKEATLCTSLVSTARSSSLHSLLPAETSGPVVTLESGFCGCGVLLVPLELLPHKTNTGLTNVRLGGVLMWPICPPCCWSSQPRHNKESNLCLLPSLSLADQNFQDRSKCLSLLSSGRNVVHHTFG